jgi:hypothetical protein
MQETRTTLSKITFFATLIVVLMILFAIVFPGVYHYFFAGYPTQLETPFELGHKAYLLIGSNIVLFGFGIIYYKNKFSFINTKIDQIRNFEISKKLSVIIILFILITYSGFSIPELFLDEREQWGDYILLEDALELWPNGTPPSGEPYLEEQLDRYVRMALLDASVKIFQNIKVLPFLASILVVFFTYLLTVQFTGKRFAGIISMLVLLQSHIFITFDTIAVYENFWVLFFMISVYAVRRKWVLSPLFYILAVFTKAYVAPFFLMTLYTTYRSEIGKRKKYLIFGSYIVIILVAIGIILLGKSLYTDVIEIEFSRFFLGFADTAMQFRYDIFFTITILPVVVGLYLLSKNTPDTDTIHSLILGAIIFSPILITFTYFYEILPYRHVPTLVFFAIGVGFFFSKKFK